MNYYSSSNNPPNIPANLHSLFKAMSEGKQIKSVTCMDGEVNSNNPARDFKIEDFVAIGYYEGFQSNSKGDKFDYVITSSVDNNGNRLSFYMNWVREFEL